MKRRSGGEAIGPFDKIAADRKYSYTCLGKTSQVQGRRQLPPRHRLAESESQPINYRPPRAANAGKARRRDVAKVDPKGRTFGHLNRPDWLSWANFWTLMDANPNHGEWPPSFAKASEGRHSFAPALWRAGIGTNDAKMNRGQSPNAECLTADH